MSAARAIPRLVRSLDHPAAVVAGVTAMGAMFLLGAVRIEAGSGGASIVVIPFLATACGAVMFGFSASAGARWSRAVDALDSGLVLVFGLGFAIWGLVLLPMLGGLFGVLPAIVCTAALWILMRDWRLAAAPLPALGPAWGITLGLDALGVRLPGDFAWVMAPVIVWNIEMAIVFAIWSAWRRRHPRPDPAFQCHACAYSLAGLREPICPECGASVFIPRGRRPDRSAPL